MTLKNHIQLQLSVLFGALALIVSGCSSNDPEVIPSEDTSLAMLFGSDVSATRAMIESKEDLQKVADGFGVYGSKNNNELFKNQKVTWNSASTNTDTKWEYTPIKYWDQSSSVTYDFGAYAPYKSNDYVSSTDNKFTVTGIPQWQACFNNDGTANSKVYDFLVAENRTGSYNDFSNGIVDFNFKHKLAKVTITITKENTTTLNGITFTVKNVTIGGNGSDYYTENGAKLLAAAENSKAPTKQDRSFTRSYLAVDGGTDAFAAPETFAENGIALYNDETGKEVEISPAYTTITTYLVAPFDLEKGKTIPITVTYTKVTDKTEEITSPSATSLTGFLPGYEYNIKLKVGAVKVTTEAVEIQKWETGGSADDDVYNW